MMRLTALKQSPASESTERTSAEFVASNISRIEITITLLLKGSGSSHFIASKKDLRLSSHWYIIWPSCPESDNLEVDGHFTGAELESLSIKKVIPGSRSSNRC